MKYLGLLCMAAAAVAGGFLLAGEWEMRVKMLGIFRQMAVYLKARILYSNETLPEALKEIGSRFSDGNSGMAAEAGLFFLRVEKRMEEEAGKPFAAIWKENRILKHSRHWGKISVTRTKRPRSGRSCSIWNRRMTPWRS